MWNTTLYDVLNIQGAVIDCTRKDIIMKKIYKGILIGLVSGSIGISSFCFYRSKLQ
ncbi:hypothetical protein IRP63_15455 (plasmid) [Clostridium botulinum]|uniref:hypothetical protein n=1 Tax=Clostridium botulinum TaxID=1491 RepID=UPI000AED5454|nr:hypothetical protein [Clostridium botulinum]MCD3235205.1 hypothetical protein [Clostridium botulinum D/C]MCD3241137.1 hypothetical protein [Clostridium botulinum D/C]MCD3268577.1 hypothetical protein [Clostridium botulinum D/C]MCD3300655.1 hypothetical protein [Clostridium botulinum D/C]MCD3306921.1 hypothetical protein [Clostridium botulinum D/C]